MKNHQIRVLKNAFKQSSFLRLQAQIDCCEQCSTCHKNKALKTLFGNPNGVILILLSYPSEGEEIEFLKDVLNALNINLDIFTFSYAFHCNVYRKNIMSTPSLQEARMCSIFTKEVINIIEPLAILCFGTLASNLFHYQTLDDAMKEENFIDNIPLITTYPLEYLLKVYQENKERYNELYACVLSKINKVLDYIAENYPEIPLFKEGE